MAHIHGGDVYSYDAIKDFSANINFLGMPESVKEALRASIEQSVNYPDPKNRKLHLAISQREQLNNEKELIFGNGAAELLFAYMMALKPEKVLLAIPSFYEYEQALQVCTCTIDRYDMSKQIFMIKEDFCDHITEKTDLVILGNPNNPTGRMIEKTVLKSIIKTCKQTNTALLIDESFYDFFTDDQKAQTLSGCSQISEYDRLFILKSFTKMYAMPGIRLGYGICQDTDFLDEMRRYLQPWNVSVPAQMAGCAAAEEIAFAHKTAQMAAQNRAEVYEKMLQIGYQVYPSDTNFLLFKGPEMLREYCIKNGFLLRDCSNFPGLECAEEGMKFYRICIRSQKENLELLQILKNALKHSV